MSSEDKKEQLINHEETGGEGDKLINQPEANPQVTSTTSVNQEPTDQTPENVQTQITNEKDPNILKVQDVDKQNQDIKKEEKPNLVYDEIRKYI